MSKLDFGASVKELMDLQGKTIIIVGGAGFLGSYMASALAEAGANIAIADRNAQQGIEICQQLRTNFDVEARFYQVDLLNDTQVAKIPSTVANDFGSLDSVIYAAAIVIDKYIQGWSEEFAKQSSEQWRDALQINLTSAFTIIRESHPYLKVSDLGTVINVISHYGLVAPDYSIYEGTKMTNPAAYAASKGGLLQLTRWLSSTMAPEVRVNAITPGGIFRNHDEPFLTNYKSKTLLGRMGKEEDFKGATIFLTSKLSNYVTGQNIVIDGGLTAH